MGLWRFEYRKLWKNKLVCGLILGCFLLNGACLFWQAGCYDEESRCFPDAIKDVYEALQQIPQQEQIAWLDSEIKRLERAAYGPDGMEEANRDYEKRNAVRHVQKHAEAVYGYDRYLEGIKEQARLISGSSLFGGGDLYPRRNAERILQKYSRLHSVRLKLDNSQGVRLATEPRITDVILIALFAILAFFFFGMEREEGTMAFVRCTRYGGTRLGRIKAAAVLLGSLAGALILYLSNYSIAGAMYGFGDMGRRIQSVEGYLESPFELSVEAYLLLFLLAKLAAFSIVAWLFMWIVLWGKSLIGTGAAFFGIMAFEYACYAALPPHSWLDVLKQCSLFSFLGTERFFKSYETLCLFGYPVSAVPFGAAAGAVFLALAAWAVLGSYERVSRSEYTQTSSKGLILAGRRRKNGHSLLYYEAYKILGVSGAGILLAAFLVLQFAAYSGETAYFTLDELYYKHYMKTLEGEMTDEKLYFIQKEGRRIKGLKQELSHLAEREGGGQKAKERQIVLERQLACEDAFHRVQEQAKRIGTNGVFLDEVGFAHLLDARQQVFQVGKLLLVWILAFHSAFLVDKRAGMQSVWNTVPDGKKKIWRQKWILLAGGIVFLCAASDVLSAAFCMKSQGIASLHVPIQYLKGLEAYRGVSAGGYLIVLCMLKMLLLAVACRGIERISEKAKNATTVLLAAGACAGVCYLLLAWLAGGAWQTP